MVRKEDRQISQKGHEGKSGESDSGLHEVFRHGIKKEEKLEMTKDVLEYWKQNPEEARATGLL